MTTIDKDTLDYLKSNIEREVRENVESRLFKTWLKVAAAFLAGVGLVGTPWLISYLDGKIISAVEKHVEAKVKEPAEHAKGIADQARNAAETAREKVMAAVADIDARRRMVDELIAELRTKSNTVVEQVDKLRSDFDSRSKQIDTSLKSAGDRLAEINDQASQLSHRLRFAVPDANVVASLAKDVKTLVAEIKRLDEDLARVAQKVEIPVGNTPEQRATITALERSTAAGVETVQTDLPTSTVYVQFAGSVSREVVKRLSMRLTRAGWRVPGEERLGAAAGLREIRCFYEADCKKAEDLKQQLDVLLADLYRSTRYELAIKPLYKFSPKPRPGILELWIELADPPT